MKSKRLFVMFLVVSIVCGAAWQFLTLRGQAQESQKVTDYRGGIINSYREDEGLREELQTQEPQAKQRPAWVEEALKSSYSFLNERRRAGKKQNTPVETDAQEEFKLRNAEQDDLGQTHVRFAQFHQGVPVFGKEIIAHCVFRRW